MTAKLDRSRPYATVRPPQKGIFFEQDDKKFDQAGREVGSEKAKPPEPKPKAPEAAADPVSPAPVQQAAPNIPSNFMQFRAMVKEHTGVTPKDKAEGMALLEREGII